jgi:hypothetical protein
MKNTQWLGLMTAVVLPLSGLRAQTSAEAPAPPAAQAPSLSPGSAEVVRLAGAGTSDDVVLAYIQNSTATFDLNADQILYLRDIGVSSPVITAMLTRDNTLKTQAPAYTYDQRLYPATANPVSTQPVQPPPPEPAPLTPPSAVEAPPVYVSSPPPEVGYFYDDLSPYGSWVQLDGIGWCWQPRVVVINHGWRPYCDSGHWVYTDAGWFWQSDYSWGWAPFHYGRWQLHERCGWVWTPDRVWGPAWVTWRYEGDHCGWAPLPPHADFDLRLGFRFNGARVAANFDFGLRPDHFTFIAMRDFHDHDFAHHRLPPTEVTRIYNHTTIINNYVVNKNTVVNEGIKPDRVAAATHTPIHKVVIRDVPAAGPAAAAHGGARGELAVYRPELKAPPRPVHMVAQKVDDRHPVIQHAPVSAAPRTERPLVAGNSGAGYHGPVNSSPNTFQRPAGNRSPTAPQQEPARSNHPATSTTPAPSTSAPRNYQQPKSAPLTPPSRYEQPEKQTPPPTRGSVVKPQPAPNRRPPVPSGSSANYSTTPRPSAPEQNSRAYQPKGYYQSSEIHSLPPSNPRAAQSRPEPPAVSRQQGGQESNARGQGGQGPGNRNDR